MDAIEQKIPGVFILIPKKFEDSRGFFYESFNNELFSKLTRTNFIFVQDNHSYSIKNTLRGLHFQVDPFSQGKIVRVISGKIFDVAVDIRKNSPTFGEYISVELSSENFKQFWIPPGFAHGFYVLSENAEVSYKTTEYYAPNYERSIIWNDADVGIDWPIKGNQIEISKKDMEAITLKDYLNIK